MGSVTGDSPPDPRTVVVCVPARGDDPWRRVLGAGAIVQPGEDIGPAGADWVLFADPGVIPAPNLLIRLSAAVGPAVHSAYSSFEVVGDGPRPIHTHDPGGWSVERSRWRDYTGPVALVRREFAVDAAGSVRGRLPALREAARAGGVAHVAESLYAAAGWRETPVAPMERAELLRWAAAPYLLGPDGRTRVAHLPDGGAPPTISVVIPTRGGSGTVRGQRGVLLDRAIGSILAHHPEAGLEFVLVLDDDAPGEPVTRWRDRLDGSLRTVALPGPFNFSRKVNAGIAAAAGQVVAVVNDDIEVITPAALHLLAAVALEPDVGAVGALLRYEDGSLQHAGQAFADDGVHHIGAHQDPQWPRRNADLLVDRDVAGVTAACLVQRKEVWEDSGGLDPMLPVSFNDVEYCWRLRQRGLRIVQCNSVELFHFESKTRAPGAQPWEVERLRSRLGPQAMRHDPFTPAGAVLEPRLAGPRYRERWNRLRQRTGR